jgi:3-deoxy-manno-octulosonate cytidylyltransferase (CMP-KDO synthetase)
MTRVLGIIPARYASTRFPGKPLVLIGGKSMLQRVYEQAQLCMKIDRILVATDDTRIEDHVRSFGGDVMLTASFHLSGTERIGEVVHRLSSEEKSFSYDIILNIQGDEPFLDPRQLDDLISAFNEKSVMIATLHKRIADSSELFNPNVVKVVSDAKHFALYFSRSPIPFNRDHPETAWTSSAEYYKHIGLYAFRSEIFQNLLQLTPDPLEQAESLEQLRWLSHGYRIKLILTTIENIAIDTPEDLLKLTNKLGV